MDYSMAGINFFSLRLSQYVNRPVSLLLKNIQKFTQNGTIIQIGDKIFQFYKLQEAATFLTSR